MISLEHYIISRFANYIQSEDMCLIYCRYHLFLFSDLSFKWFVKITDGSFDSDIPKSFIQYLLDNQIIVVKGDKNESQIHERRNLQAHVEST